MQEKSKAAFDRLFFPRRIGILGMSSRPATWGRLTVERLRAGGFDGEIIAIGPRSEVEIPSVADFGELDAPLDLLVVAVPPKAAVDGVARARAAGTGAVIVLSAGFAETGPEGIELQEQLRAAAGDMPLVGPNCVGLVSRPGALHASPTHYFDRPAPAPGPVAIITHSGGMGIVLAELLEQRGVSYSYYVSAGNEACDDVSSLGRYLLSRPDVRVLCLYLEAVRDPAALAELGRAARESGKQVVVLKTGVSEAGKRAAFSHTAAVAGDALLFAALCRQAGILVAQDDEDFAETVLACAQGEEIRTRSAGRTVVVTMSGGGGALLADRLSVAGADVFELPGHLAERIRALGFPGLAGAGNPVDVGAQWKDSVAEFTALLRLLDEEAHADLIVVYFAIADSAVDSVRLLADEMTRLRTPARMVWAAAPPGAADGLLPGTVWPSVAALTRHLAAAGTGPAPEEAPAAADAPDAVSDAGALLRAGAVGGVVTEAAGHPALSLLAVPYAPTAVCSDAADDLVLPDSPDGRYVVKVDSPDAVHRAKLGLVRIGVPAADVPGAVRELAALAERQGVRTARRLVVQPLVPHSGLVAVGAVRDELYGPALLVGAGGDRAEAADAARTAVLLPASRDALRAAATRVAHGVGPVDEEALTNVLVTVAELVLHTPDLRELDINPLLVTDGGAPVAVDCLFGLA
ncbi:acetate--CoA ligase family protein [Streptomyces sp. NPDC057889]|uniref:acetate--CoA ligase family protein n=1 Tax=unclassified Streptomyces TaxID=2593676 RepID=UPI0036A13594